MPITQLVNREWLDQNGQRKYPLAIDASALSSSTGDFKLPNDFLVELYLAVPTAIEVDPASYMIHSIQAFSTGFAVTIGYWDGSASNPIATASVLRSAHTLYKAYELIGLGDFYDIRGNMVIGRLDSIDSQPPGEWKFDLDGGRLEVETVRPQIRGVTQFRVQNGTDLSDPITGDVVLRAGKNIRLTTVISSGDDPEIVIDAIQGEGLNDTCVCEGNGTEGTPIRTINNIPPSANGDFTMFGTGCIELNAVDHGLELNDTCAKPCCGCKELEVVTAALENFGSVATTLNNFLVGLEARVSQMDMTVLGSKLGDQGCLSE